MKKSLIPFMAALVLPFSCAQLEEPSAAPEGGDGTHLVISASPSPVSSSPATRTELNGDNTVSFLETDALSVFSRVVEDDDVRFEKSEFSVSRLYDDGSADFEGNVASADGTMPVMYPFQKDAKIEKYNKTYRLEFNVPVEQKAVPGTFDPDAAISLGMAVVGEDGKVRVSLSNTCALVKFTVPLGEYSKVTLNARGGICGLCLANVNSSAIDEAVISQMEGDVSETVTLKGDITGGNTYFIAVVPGEYPGISVRLFDRDGKVAGEKATADTVTFTKGGILNIGLLPTTSPTWSGSGTADDPYRIETSAHLRLLAQAFSLRETARPYEGAYFKQTRDINMEREVITIGNFADRYRDTTPSWDVPTTFNANYDGDGYTISNYRLKFINYRLNAHYLAGLFNCVSDATIKNLNISPAKQESGFLIDGIESSLDYYYIGLLAGEIDGECTISNCHVLPGSYTIKAYDGSSFDASQTVVLGGLVGRTIGSSSKNVIFSNCTNEANLKIEYGINRNVAGGIIGTNFGTHQYQYIDRCRNKGDITVVSEKKGSGPEVFAGGIIGRITDDGSDVVFRISNCVNEGTVTAENNASENACAGGIAGSNDSDGWVDLDFESVNPWVYNCLNKGDISASGDKAYSGGIFGYCYDADTKLALCVNTGRITAGGASVKGPICATGGDHWWCFWLVPDEFKNYTPANSYHCYPCTGEYAGTPEYIRLNGKANGSETGANLFEKTEWSQSDWANAASWTGSSDTYWDTIDLIF